MHDDPITLHVAVDRDGNARGTLYIDDGSSFGYKQGKSIYVEFTYKNEVLTAKMLHNPGMETKVWLEKIVILGGGAINNPAKIVTKGDVTYADTLFEPSKNVLTVRKPGVNLGEEFTISFED